MRNLRRPVKVKVCGMTNLGDALFAVECGADAVGFIFYKKSPRYVSAKIVKNIVAQLPPFTETVGVFVNESADKINRIAESCKLDRVQLHGEESPALCKRIRHRVIKGVRVKDASSLSALESYKECVGGFLLDSYVEDKHGGTGKVFDWKLAHRAKKSGHVIVAGGLTPDNVSEAIRQLRPYGVDVCSGVEKMPGQKDPAKVADFLKAVKGNL